MALPTPPPITHAFLISPNSVAAPRGPTKSNKKSPSFIWERSIVVCPTIWKIIETEPSSALVSAIVRGILSPRSSILKIMNWPAFAFLAINGASTSKRTTVSLSCFLRKILYIP